MLILCVRRLNTPNVKISPQHIDGSMTFSFNLINLVQNLVHVCKMITLAVSDVSHDYSNKHIRVSNPHEHVVDEQVERPEISKRCKRCIEISTDVECSGSRLQRAQGSHFFGLTNFHDISMIFPGFLVNFQVFFSLFLKYDFQVVLNINMQNYSVLFEQKINYFNFTPN